MKNEEKAIIAAAVGIFAFFVLASGDDDRGIEGPSDLDALARMLASETANELAWPAIGWLTIQSARRRRQTIYRRLTDGLGFGPRVLNGHSRYASTQAQATKRSTDFARRLLLGEVQPSKEIRDRPLSSWVERLKTATDRSVLNAQNDFGGIWARINGTDWYLFDEKAPKIQSLSTARKISAV